MSSRSRSGKAWLLQAVTGAILTLAVLAHIYRVHLTGSAHGIPTYEEVISALKNPLVMAGEMVLATAATFHALYGLHMVLVEAQLLREDVSKKVMLVIGIIIMTWLIGFNVIILLK